MNTSIVVEKLSSSAQLDRRTMITTVRVEARVNRPFAQIAPLIQPESWALAPCFKAVYPVRCDRLGRPVPRERDADSGFERATKQASGAWSAMYYEHVKSAMVGGGSAEFRNLLDIDFEASTTAAELRFSLNECISVRWGLLRRAGGIDVDSGYNRVEARGKQMTYVDAVKSIRFTPFEPAELGALRLLGVEGHALNLLAPTFLAPWMEQLVLRGCAEGLAAGHGIGAETARIAA